jgi:hypothetical protein
VKIGNATGKTGHGKLSAGKQTVEATWNETGGRAEVNMDMGGAKLWDDFSPNLSEVTVKLGGDERTVRFGMRKFAAHGTLECSVWPLTGYPPTDVDSWRRIIQIEKTYGLNFIRFHSWCPPEAAFAASQRVSVAIRDRVRGVAGECQSCWSVKPVVSVLPLDLNSNIPATVGGIRAWTQRLRFFTSPINSQSVVFFNYLVSVEIGATALPHDESWRKNQGARRQRRVGHPFPQGAKGRDGDVAYGLFHGSQGG